MFFSSHHPLANKVQATFDGSIGGTVYVQIEATPDLVQRPSDNSLHSGFATIILDSIMGGAVMGTLKQLMPIATIGLSMHHMRRAIAGETLKGKAICTGTHNDVAYVTGELLGENGEPVAIASGTFMIGTRGTSIRSKSDKAKTEASRI
jgi:acyl-coenzyme A thioesterase PaaI-like protein